MRIVDNNSNLYALAGNNKPATYKPVEDLQQGLSPSITSPLVKTAVVEPLSEVKKQQLLQSYSEQNKPSSDLLGYPQQRAVEAYSQHAQQDELLQLQEMMGIDEYV